MAPPISAPSFAPTARPRTARPSAGALSRFDAEDIAAIELLCGFAPGRRQGRRPGFELQARQASVKPILGEEADVGSSLEDAAALHHQNAIGIDYGRQAM